MISIILISIFFRVSTEDLHSVPVQQMGNYQEYLKKQSTPLRELETQPVRQHMFGNPFKVNKVRFIIRMIFRGEPRGILATGLCLFVCLLGIHVSQFTASVFDEAIKT